MQIALRLLVLIVACFGLLGMPVSTAATCCESPEENRITAGAGSVEASEQAGNDCAQDDGCDDECLAGCGCCPHAPPVAEPEAPVASPNPTPNVHPLGELTSPTFPDPDKLLHVPRSV